MNTHSPEWESAEQLQLLLIARGFSKQDACQLAAGPKLLKFAEQMANLAEY